jgi:hypothetical protein
VGSNPIYHTQIYVRKRLSLPCLERTTTMPRTWNNPKLRLRGTEHMVYEFSNTKDLGSKR